jgi:cytochrome P450
MNERFDPGRAYRFADPLPALRALQDADAVHWSERYRAWLITRYDDVRAGLADPRLSTARAMPAPDAFEPGFRAVFADYRRYLDPWMVFRDPPDHTRLRGLVNKGLTPGAIQALRPRIEVLVAELLETMPRAGACDLIPALAYPLPAAVIAELIGVPRAVLDDLKRWSDGVASSTATGGDVYTEAAVAVGEMGAYLAGFVAERRRKPGSSIIDALIAAQEGQDRLSSDELVSNLILFLFAGHETTTNLLSNGLRTLLRNPAQLADLRRNLDDVDLVRNTVEEILRYDGALFLSLRVAKESFDWHGRAIAPGDRVFLYHLAANHDPRCFNQPERFDIRRADAKKHIAFGYGIHFCLGAPLARLEMEVALPALLRSYRDIRLLEDEVLWKDNFVLRGPRSLRLDFGSGAVA